ncbi:MAG: hypothetical protein QN152_02615 [Armatimonadota bacterium]|nr:hypothetical protein [Armatimonadota bacterium]MDR7465315.1 hypothetical protein [Armatimonadota bacterium]MDR7470265.1 hypothetical protein [Armatimonadota bacterium]MDR7473422.1 hypothetical protein [Armatimonadota bacterium]MDR7538409.1 hypothetical protein [Armatimonadota bacterium]
MSDVVLAVDPGRQKCGLAVGRPGELLARTVVPASQAPEVVAGWVKQYGVGRIIVGGGTGSEAVLAALSRFSGLVRVETVQERGTTLEARRRYFRDHPPRGWRRLIPLSLQVPPEQYDDYVAVLLLERALAGGR